MIIQQAIEKAIEGGYKGNREALIRLPEYAQAQLWIDPEFWKALGKSMGWTGEKIRMCTGCGVALRGNEKPTMDWKHGGKNGCGSDIYEYEGQWLIEMHKLVDHLAEGNSIESYFETL